MVFMLPRLANGSTLSGRHQRFNAIYITAVDRSNTRVASIYDSLHPAMLRALS